MADEDKKVFMVSRMLTFQTGEKIYLPIGCFDNEEAAAKTRDNRDRGFGELLTMHLARPYQSPEGAVSLKPIGVTMGQFMHDVGIMHLQHGYLEMEVRSSDILVANKKIIIPH